jgi:hypothetical protein
MATDKARARVSDVEVVVDHVTYLGLQLPLGVDAAGSIPLVTVMLFVEHDANRLIDSEPRDERD